MVTDSPPTSAGVLHVVVTRARHEGARMWADAQGGRRTRISGFVNRRSTVQSCPMAPASLPHRRLAESMPLSSARAPSLIR